MPAYLWVSALDNTTPNQVLIGATDTESYQNLIDAINANPATVGVAYSWPTQENAAMNADELVLSPLSTTITVRAKIPGTAGNSYGLSETTSNFTWAGSHPTGGTDDTTTPLTVGVLGAAAGSGLLYTRGSTAISTAVPVASGTWLQVSYYRLGAAFIVVEDTALIAARAAIEHGTGLYQQLMLDTANADPVAGTTEAQNALAEFRELPETLVLATYVYGYQVGQYITLALTNPLIAAPVVNGQWRVQALTATYMAGQGRFLYMLTLTSAAVASWQSFWEQFARQ